MSQEIAGDRVTCWADISESSSASASTWSGITTSTNNSSKSSSPRAEQETIKTIGSAGSWFHCNRDCLTNDDVEQSREELALTSPTKSSKRRARKQKATSKFLACERDTFKSNAHTMAAFSIPEGEVNSSFGARGVSHTRHKVVTLDDIGINFGKPSDIGSNLETGNSPKLQSSQDFSPAHASSCKHQAWLGGAVSTAPFENFNVPYEIPLSPAAWSVSATAVGSDNCGYLGQSAEAWTFLGAQPHVQPLGDASSRALPGDASTRIPQGDAWSNCSWGFPTLPSQSWTGPSCSSPDIANMPGTHMVDGQAGFTLTSTSPHASNGDTSLNGGNKCQQMAGWNLHTFGLPSGADLISRLEAAAPETYED